MSKKIAPYILICLVFLGCGFFLGTNLEKKEPTNTIFSKEKREKLQGKLISPLLECEQPEQVTIGKYKKLEEKLQTLIHSHIEKDQASQVSIYYRDLSNGPWIGIDEGFRFAPASLLKLPLMMSYFKAAQDNPGLLETKLPISSKEASDGSPSIQFITPKMNLQRDTEYTVEEIIHHMIAYSDNVAWFTLVDNLNARLLQNIYADLGLPFPSVEQPSDFISVREYASFFRVLYNSSYLNQDMSEKALRLLTETDFNDGLKKGVPANITVAHKFGERVVDQNTRQFHDCGIIYRPSHPYILCVMTRGDDFNKLIEVIQSISKATYEGIN